MSVAGKTREMAMTKDVLDHHLKCFGEGDLKGILSDYAPSAVLFTRVDRFKEPTRLDRYSRQLLRSLKSLAQGLA